METCLALITSNSKETADFSEHTIKPTLIFCPPNRYWKWIDRAKQMDPTLKVIGVSSKKDHMELCWDSFLNSDIVIICYNLFTLTYYERKCNRNEEEDVLAPSEKEIDLHLQTKGRVIFTLPKYRRIFFDNFYYLENIEDIRRISGLFKWVLYPSFNFAKFDCSNSHDLHELKTLINYLDIGYKNTAHVKKIISSRYTVSGKPTGPPPFETAIINIDIDKNEEKMASKMEGVYSKQKYLCLNENKINFNFKDGDCPISADLARIFVTGKFYTDIRNQRKIIRNKCILIREADDQLLKFKNCNNNNNDIQNQSDLEHSIEDFIKSKRSMIKRDLEKTEKICNENERKLSYFNGVFLDLQDSSKDTICGICRDTFNDSNICFVKCGHIFCFNCLSAFSKEQQKCPICRTVNINNCISIKISELLKTKKQIWNENLSFTYGKKFSTLYHYLKTVLFKDGNNRIVIYLKWKDVIGKISKAFKKLKVRHCCLHEGVFGRKRSIEKFENSQRRVLLMSYEDNVEGIELQQVTHFIILHPFIACDGYYDRKQEEMENIGLSCVLGSSNNMVQVVRFHFTGVKDESSKYY